jgi:hypothetical protein
MGALLVSPFNVECECYSWAGGVEVLTFCLFLVVFPAGYISRVSPRFCFKKHASCFLPLVADFEEKISFPTLVYFFIEPAFCFIDSLYGFFFVSVSLISASIFMIFLLLLV